MSFKFGLNLLLLIFISSILGCSSKSPKVKTFSSTNSSGYNCQGFSNNFSKKNVYKTKGFFKESGKSLDKNGWTKTIFEICKKDFNKNKTGFTLEYYNPSLNTRFLTLDNDGIKRFPLKNGTGQVNICPSNNDNKILLSVSSKFVPNLEIPGSSDIRPLGINIRNISDFDCSTN